MSRWADEARYSAGRDRSPGCRRSSGRPRRGREDEPRPGARGWRDIEKRRARVCRRRCRGGGLTSAGAPASLSRPWRRDALRAVAGAKSGAGERGYAGVAVASVDRRARTRRRCRGRGGARLPPGRVRRKSGKRRARACRACRGAGGPARAGVPAAPWRREPCPAGRRVRRREDGRGIPGGRCRAVRDAGGYPGRPSPGRRGRAG
jgi:hypothetical protein